MSPVGPLRIRRTPEPVRRELEVATAAAWEAVVEAHAREAVRFAGLLGDRMGFSSAVERYLSEVDVHDPMASAVRSRALTAVRETVAEVAAPAPDPEAPAGDAEGLKRFRPDRVVRGIARKVRESEDTHEWIHLAIARAEETVLRVHIEKAVGCTVILREHQPLDEAVEDYIDLMRITGGRAQAVYQRTMARLADLHLPAAGAAPEGAPGG